MSAISYQASSEVIVPSAIYAAKSSPQDDDESTGAQIVACREGIAREPNRVLCCEPFSEENVSAYRGNRGPELEAAIRAAVSAAEQHGSAELWVWKSNRLARGSGRKSEARSLLELFTDLRRQGVTLRSVTDDEYLREEFIGMASRMSHKFAEDLGSDVRRGRRRAFDAGEHGGGPCWDGYRDIPVLDANDQPQLRRSGMIKMTRTKDPDREPAIERLWALLLDGAADTIVAKTLNREGHRTRDGRAWSRRRVQDTRTNPIYAGAVVWHRGKPDEEINWEGAHDGTYLTRQEWERLQQICAERDNAPGRRPRGGRPTRLYALSKLAVCERCGEPMYAMTSAYRRKRDGAKGRAYLCKNVHVGTGLCDAPRIDAEVVDLAVISHLDTLFIDFDGWIAELDQASTQRRAEVGVALEAELAKLDHLERRAQRIERDYLRQVDEGNERAADFASRMLDRTSAERSKVEHAIQQLKAHLYELNEPATDAMLDVYSKLRDTVQGAARDPSDGLGTLNDRLRTIFQEFRLEKVDEDVVGILPILRPDVIERFGAERTTMISGDVEVTARQATSPAAPVALFAAGDDAVRPPAKALRAPLSKADRGSYGPLSVLPSETDLAQTGNQAQA
jgi:site-specific DNA recombinase